MGFPPIFISKTPSRNKFLHIFSKSWDVNPQYDRSNLTNSWGPVHNDSISLIVPSCVTNSQSSVVQNKQNICFFHKPQIKITHTDPIQVPPRFNTVRLEDWASWQRLSITDLLNLIPVRLNSENLQTSYTESDN